jgi:hypothetical protein
LLDDLFSYRPHMRTVSALWCGTPAWGARRETVRDRSWSGQTA